MTEKTAAEKAQEIDKTLKAAADKKRADEAAAGETLNKLLTGLTTLADMCDSLNKRMDGFDAKLKKGAEPFDGKDLPRGDGDGDDDPFRLPGQARKVVADADDVHSDEHKNKIADAQFLADRCCNAWGLRADPPLAYEKILAYRKRMLRPWVKYSDTFKHIDLDTVNDAKLFDAVEGKIYNDAIAASCDVSSVPEGRLREIRKRDATGREIIEYQGEPRVWMSAFSANRRRLIGIRNSS